MFGLFLQLDKRGISSEVRVCIEKAGAVLGVTDTPYYSKLKLSSLQLTDFASKALNKKNGWNVKHINEHCSNQILASYVCFVSYYSINTTDPQSGVILKEGIKIGLNSAGILSGNSPAKKIEIAVIGAMIKILREDGLDVEEILGISSVAI